jgi:hypothetical protein
MKFIFLPNENGNYYREAKPAEGDQPAKPRRKGFLIDVTNATVVSHNITIWEFPSIEECMLAKNITKI